MSSILLTLSVGVFFLFELREEYRNLYKSPVPIFVMGENYDEFDGRVNEMKASGLELIRASQDMFDHVIERQRRAEEEWLILIKDDPYLIKA